MKIKLYLVVLIILIVFTIIKINNIPINIEYFNLDIRNKEILFTRNYKLGYTNDIFFNFKKDFNFKKIHKNNTSLKIINFDKNHIDLYIAGLMKYMDAVLIENKIILLNKKINECKNIYI